MDLVLARLVQAMNEQTCRPPIHRSADLEKAWLEAETDCILLEVAIRAAIALMEDDREPYPERHYYGKRKLYKALTDLKVQRAGPR